jgi:alpha-N-acetylglucosamine transferase
MFAWATLLSHPEYVVGVKALHHSLRQTDTKWPLVVMVTDAISPAQRETLQMLGCVIQPVESIYPHANLPHHYASVQFGETWTKLRAWQLTEFARIVLLDADMLVLRNMDELFLLDLGPHDLAASHACRCNPDKISTYPVDWQPENCHYSWQERGDSAPEHLDRYLNSGLLVLTPDDAIFEQMSTEIATIDDLSAYPFPEQDFLNEFFAKRWMALSHTYNALKTLPYQHSALWRWHEIKNLHYILAKPWKRNLAQAAHERDRYYTLDKFWWEKAGLAVTQQLG